MGIEPIQPMEEPVAPRGMRAALVGTGALSVLGVFVGIATSALLARALGPEGRGEYAAVLNWPNFIAALGLLGLNYATIYFSATEPACASSWSTNALWLTLGGWVVSSTACWFLMPWLLAAQSEATVTTARAFGIVYGLGMAGWSIGIARLQGLRVFREWNALRGAQMLLWLLLISTWVLLDIRSVRVFALCYGATFLVLTPVALLLKRQDRRWSFDPKRSRRLLAYGIPTLMASLPSMVNRRLDQLMMATFVQPGVLGLYAAAVTVTIPLSVLSVPVANVIMPSIASAGALERKADLLGRTTRATTLVLLLAAACLMAVVPVLVPLVFGRAFEAAVRPALVLVAAAVLLGVTTVLEDALMGLGRPRAVLKAEMGGLALTVIGLTATLSRWPLLGAAVTSLVAYAASLWLALRECRNAVGLSLADMVIPGREELYLVARWIRNPRGPVAPKPSKRNSERESDDTV